MNLRTARLLAYELMELHGLDDLTFEWMNAKRRLGELQSKREWNPDTRTYDLRPVTLRLSRSITRHQPDEAVRQTILHEIAHALVGGNHGHDRVWKMQARAIGYTGERTSEVAESHAVETANWIGRCPNGHVMGRQRRPKSVATNREESCSRCSRRFDRRFLITWYPAHLYREVAAQFATKDSQS